MGSPCKCEACKICLDPTGERAVSGKPGEMYKFQALGPLSFLSPDGKPYKDWFPAYRGRPGQERNKKQLLADLEEIIKAYPGKPGLHRRLTWYGFNGRLFASFESGGAARRREPQEADCLINLGGLRHVPSAQWWGFHDRKPVALLVSEDSGIPERMKKVFEDERFVERYVRRYVFGRSDPGVLAKYGVKERPPVLLLVNPYDDDLDFGCHNSVPLMIRYGSYPAAGKSKLLGTVPAESDWGFDRIKTAMDRAWVEFMKVIPTTYWVFAEVDRDTLASMPRYLEEDENVRRLAREGQLTIENFTRLVKGYTGPHASAGGYIGHDKRDPEVVREEIVQKFWTPEQRARWWKPPSQR